MHFLLFPPACCCLPVIAVIIARVHKEGDIQIFIHFVIT